MKNRLIKKIGLISLMLVVGAITRPAAPQPAVQNMDLLYVSHYGDQAMVAQLLQTNANPNMTNKMQETPLMHAAYQGHLAVITQLLAAGANVNAIDAFKRTPLMHAADKGHYEVAKTLFEADPSSALITDHLGQKAIDIAAKKGHTEIVKLLSTALGDIVYIPSKDDEKLSDTRYLSLDEKPLKVQLTTEKIAELFADGPAKRTASDRSDVDFAGPAPKKARLESPKPDGSGQ